MFIISPDDYWIDILRKLYENHKEFALPISFESRRRLTQAINILGVNNTEFNEKFDHYYAEKQISFTKKEFLIILEPILIRLILVGHRPKMTYIPDYYGQRFRALADLGLDHLFQKIVSKNSILVYDCPCELNYMTSFEFEFIFLTRKSNISEILQLLSLYKYEVNPITNNFVLQIVADKIDTLKDMTKLNTILKNRLAKGTIFHELEVNFSNLKSIRPRMTHEDFT